MAKQGNKGVNINNGNDKTSFNEYSNRTISEIMGGHKMTAYIMPVGYSKPTNSIQKNRKEKTAGGNLFAKMRSK